MMPALEQEYRAARFREYWRISRNVSLAGAVLVLGLWLRDYIHDSALAQSTVSLRLLIAAGAVLYALSLSLRVPRMLVLATGYVCLITVEFTLLEIWTRLGAGYMASFPGYLYIFLLLPLGMLPFSFRENALSLLIVPLVPNLQALAGMAPGFPLAAFNALIWPACAIALYSHREYDRLLRRLFASQRDLRDLATQDVLTGLANRRGFMQRGETACALARRHGRALAVLMLDLDHFKSVNDRYGHAAGDDVLRFVAATISLKLRSTDVCGRTGGEEFAAVLPETSLEEAAQTAERIRDAIERAGIPTDEAGEPLRITASVGVAAFTRTGESLDELLAQADKALYEAKRAGRNRVCKTTGL